ncbi:MAG: hypothetical protein R3Y39_02210 [Rikenellaceae bacterium]
MIKQKKISSNRFRVAKKLLENVIRLRHFRGHGVHSPYVYNIVRKVFMRKTLIESDNFELFDVLKSKMEVALATELQNIATVCGYDKFALNPKGEYEADIIICTSQYSDDDIDSLLQKSVKNGTTIAILRSALSNTIERQLSEHRSTIITRRKYVLIFNNHLPKQRFFL